MDHLGQGIDFNAKHEENPLLRELEFIQKQGIIAQRRRPIMIIPSVWNYI